jgi:hypothetical protein
MNFSSSTIKKYYPALVGAALIAASLFQFSRPVFSAGTEAGQTIRNTATGTYEDNDGNDYTIDSNTVEVTVARVAGITNIPSGITDLDTAADNTSVLTGDEVSFEFTITNVGNHRSNIYIPDILKVATKGLKRDDTLKLAIKGIDANDSFDDAATDFIEISDAQASGTTPVPVSVKNVPANGKIIVKVTGIVTATAAGAPIEVRLGDTGSNTDPNDPIADTQNQFDHGTGSDELTADNEVRTEEPTATTPGGTLNPDEQKEASSVEQVFLGSNPLAMTKIQKKRVINAGFAVDTDSDSNTPDVLVNEDTPLDNNVITYELDLEVLTTTPNSLFTPGKLEGRDFTGRMPGSITDPTNLVLVSDAIPVGTHLNSFPESFTDSDGRTWTPVYSVSPEPAAVTDENLAADNIEWVAEVDVTSLANVTRVGWVYDANSAQDVIAPGATITGFTFDVVTDGLDLEDGGTVANIAQVFGRTYDGDPDGDPDTHEGKKIFDESGDQDPSNFSGTNPGPSETASGSTGIANPAGHGIDSDNNNNATSSDPASPGGEDNVITIGKAGDLLNGPDGKPAATGNVFITDPDNNHDFQNKGISNFNSADCSDENGDNVQHDKDCVLDPEPVVFNNTLSNPGGNDLKDVLLQPINPGFNSFGGDDDNLPENTKVTINLGTKQAIYTYKSNKFVLDTGTSANPSQAIRIPTLAAGVPLDYTVTIDLPSGTELSTDTDDTDDTVLEGGFAVPIIAFKDVDDDGTPDPGENSNYTVNQVYTGFIKVTKQVKVMRADNNGTLKDVTGMGYGNDDEDKVPLPGDVLVYRVNYRNISEPQAGNGNNLILNGVDVMIDENGTLANITGFTDGNNWGLDNNKDDDLDTINVQGTAEDSNDGEITYYTGETDLTETDKHSVDTLTSAGTTDPGETVTGYRSTVDLLAPSEDNSTFTFQRKVDEYDGLAQEGLK